MRLLLSTVLMSSLLAFVKGTAPGAPGSRYDPSAINPHNPTTDYPYGASCATVTSNVVSSWDVHKLYEVTVVNACDRQIYDRVVQVVPTGTIEKYWNVVYNGPDGFEFPTWASVWGISPGSSLAFGFISNATISIVTA